MVSKWHPITQEKAPKRPPKTKKRKQKEAKGDGVRENGNSPTECLLDRVAHGVANRVDRLKAIGNGQVPQVAALAWEILTDDLI